MKAILYHLVSLMLFTAASFALAQEQQAAPPEPPAGTIYQWTDADGVVHITDRMDKVPKERLSTVQAISAGKPSAQDGAASPSPAPQPLSPAGDESLQQAWQQRVRDARIQLRSAEKRLEDLEQRKRNIESQWGSAGAALPPQNVLDEMRSLDAEIAQARTAVAQWKKVIESDIPDAARKAGVPPGWLRDVE